MKHLTFLLISIIAVAKLTAQKEADDPVLYDNALLISPHFNLQIPMANMGKRFGIGYEFGMGLDYKFGKNIYAGAEGGFLFGTSVKDNEHLVNVIADNGMVVTDDGPLDDIHLNLRGAIAKASVGKSFYFKKTKPNNGLLLKFSMGYFQHKILIDINKANTPQLTGNYAKGYDRFCNGFLMSQYIGLVRLERKKYINVSFGIEISEAITKNRRPYDFYLEKPMNETRFDMMIGLKFIWSIPVFKGSSTSNKQYYTY